MHSSVVERLDGAADGWSPRHRKSSVFQAAPGRPALLGLGPAARSLTKDLRIQQVLRMTDMHPASTIAVAVAGAPSQFTAAGRREKEPPDFGRFLFSAFRLC
jgi:hypothetical protein